MERRTGDRLGWATLSILLVTLLGCGALRTLPALSYPQPAATQTPAHTAAATATPPPTATPTPSATATATAAPSPTLPPTPSPTPQPTLRLLGWDPPAVQQGDTLLLRLDLAPGSRFTADFDGQPIYIVTSAEPGWALIGIPPWSALGPRPLVIRARSPGGSWQEARAMIQVTSTDFPVQAITLSPSRAKLLDPVIVQAEAARLKLVWQKTSPRPLWTGLFVLPVEGAFTASFGMRRSYNGGPATGYHGGVDIAAAEGTPVIAAAAGTVALAETLRVRGNAIVLDHGAGVHSAYYHLSRIDVSVGEQVRQGQTIGAVGATGLATGAHLHWEVRVGEIFVNPLEWTEKAMIPDSRPQQPSHSTEE